MKNLLKEKLEYNEENDTFLNVTSKFLPIISDFTNFWEKTITYSNIELFDDEIEIDELCLLFKIWCSNNQKSVFTNGNLKETEVLNILKHFFPNIEIIEDKYLLNISCSLWNKFGDISFTLNKLKECKKQDYEHAVKNGMESEFDLLIEFETAYNTWEFTNYC